MPGIINPNNEIIPISWSSSEESLSTTVATDYEQRSILDDVRQIDTENGQALAAHTLMNLQDQNRGDNTSSDSMSMSEFSDDSNLSIETLPNDTAEAVEQTAGLVEHATESVEQTANSVESILASISAETVVLNFAITEPGVQPVDGAMLTIVNAGPVNLTFFDNQNQTQGQSETTENRQQETNPSHQRRQS